MRCADRISTLPSKKFTAFSIFSAFGRLNRWFFGRAISLIRPSKVSPEGPVKKACNQSLDRQSHGGEGLHSLDSEHSMGLAGREATARVKVIVRADSLGVCFARKSRLCPGI
jgi:hypothetical protein